MTISPTLIDLAAVNSEGTDMQQIDNKSFTDIFKSRKKGELGSKDAEWDGPTDSETEGL